MTTAANRTPAFPAGAILAGILAVVIGYSGPTALVFAVAETLALSPAQTESLIWSYSIACGLVSVIGSLSLRIPIVAAWSTPGLAVLAAAGIAGGSVASGVGGGDGSGSGGGLTFPHLVGAFLLANGLIFLIGALGWFDRVVRAIPPGIAAALLAGVLFSFCSRMVGAAIEAPVLVLPMVLSYLLLRRLAPRCTILGVLVVSLGGVLMTTGFAPGPAPRPETVFELATPVFVWPEWSWQAALTVAVPLALVTISGQYLPGFAVLRASGYDAVPNSRLVRWMSGLSMIFAPFGCHAINPAAIIAALVTGPEADPDPARRYWGGVAAGLTYLLFGSFAGSFVILFALFPGPVIAALGGLALLGALTSALTTALSAEAERDAAFLTFLITASGITALGLGAAFWGILVGLAVHAWTSWRQS